MTRKWPEFSTHDLDLGTEAGTAEMQRRWETYDREMRVIIAAGGVRQDEDGWWVDEATGALIGPDPAIERPLTAGELTRVVPFEEALPDLADSIRRSRGRPPVERPKQQVTLRIDADVLERLRASGKGWQSRVNEALKKAVGL